MTQLASLAVSRLGLERPSAGKWIGIAAAAPGREPAEGMANVAEYTEWIS